MAKPLDTTSKVVRIPSGARASIHKEGAIHALLATAEVIPFTARCARTPARPIVETEADPWHRCATTARVLDQFAGLDAAGCDALIGSMVRASPDMLAAMLERSRADIRFLGGALRELITLDGQVAAAADRVLAREGA